MKNFKRSFVVVAPIEAVARFHRDTRALMLLDTQGIIGRQDQFQFIGRLSIWNSIISPVFLMPGCAALSSWAF